MVDYSYRSSRLKIHGKKAIKIKETDLQGKALSKKGND